MKITEAIGLVEIAVKAITWSCIMVIGMIYSVIGKQYTTNYTAG